jgi:predicted transcriptional regulator
VRFNLSEYNWPLIIMIAAVSATVSYVGDMLGKKIGKKRISLLGLRPRYTSTVITIFTGIAVALLTLAVAAYSSDSVKMAVFGPNIMARQMTELTNEVRSRQDELDDMTLDLIATQNELSSVMNEKETVEAEVAALKDETESLKRGLAEMKEGRVIVFQSEMLAQTSIEPGGNGYDLDSAVQRLIALSGEYVEKKMADLAIADTVDPPALMVTDEMRKNIMDALEDAEGRKVLRLTAPSNIVLGQPLEGVLSMFESRLIYREGEILMRDRVWGVRSHEDGANILYTMLKRINRSAVAKGILPDPFSGTVGNLDSLDFYDMVDKIVVLGEASRAAEVTIAAAADIYTEGPVKVKIEVGPDEEAQGGE